MLKVYNHLMLSSGVSRSRLRLGHYGPCPDSIASFLGECLNGGGGVDPPDCFEPATGHYVVHNWFIKEQVSEAKLMLINFASDTCSFMNV